MPDEPWICVSLQLLQLDLKDLLPFVLRVDASRKSEKVVSIAVFTRGSIIILFLKNDQKGTAEDAAEIILNISNVGSSEAR